MVTYRFDKKKKMPFNQDQLESIARWILEESSTPIDEIQELLHTHMLLEPKIFKGKLVNVVVEESSELTRGETIVDWLGVTNRKPNCMVMNYADDKKFFELLKNKLSNLP